MTFVSRQDVEVIKQSMILPFGDAEEKAADEMDAMMFQALIGLHATITNHLVTTAMPLPRMIGYRFFEPIPSLVMAYRLYNDASRADDVRDENKVVHPAFCPMTGLALSA
jgi:prophage DNA circulation protein